MRLLIFLTLFISQLAYSASHINDPYFIDIAEQTVDNFCENCPEFIGQMYILRPMRLSQIHHESDIQIETCQFTLVEPDLVQTAGHCGRAWLSGWNVEADYDCSKVFTFFFPDRGEGAESVRCLKIENGHEFSPTMAHTGPDNLLIRLQRPLDRPVAPSLPLADSFDHSEFKIWGLMPDESQYEQRTCRVVEKSVLSPLRAVGLKDSAFATLSCEGGDIVHGWSGAGVFANGKLIGHVSQTVSQTTYHAAAFGRNEVTVSRQSCVPLNDAVPESCYVSGATFLEAVQESFYESFDLAVHWQELVKNQLSERLIGSHFVYQKEPGSSLISSRYFELTCLDENTHPIDEPLSLVYRVEVQAESLRGKFVELNSDSQVVGLYGVGTPEPYIGGFSIPLNFHRAEYQWEQGSFKLLLNQESHTSLESRPPREVHLCSDN